MDDFIEDNDSGEDRSDDDESRAAATKRARAAKKKDRGLGGFNLGMMEGLTPEMWNEVTEVFGNGADYAWALEEDAEDKPERGLKDVREIALSLSC